MAMKRLLSRGKSIMKTSPASREVFDISEPIAVAEVNAGHLPESAASINQDNYVVEHELPAPRVDNGDEGRITTGNQRRSEKFPRPRTPSPLSRSASTSTRLPARTVRQQHVVSPPPYSSLEQNDQSWSAKISTDHSTGEGSDRVTRAPRRDDSVKRGKRRKNEEEEVEDRAELARMIGYLTATENMDWTLVIELCERASASEANAKEAVKALRWEFKYAEPSAQFAAAQLWAIMFRNSSNTLLEQIQSQKFLDTLEDVLTSPRTPDIVKERLMEVLGAVTYACGNEMNDAQSPNAGFRDLWCRLKSESDPEEGIPFDVDDEILNPSITPTISVESLDPATYDDQFLYQDLEPLSPTLERRRSDRIPRRERSLRIPQRQRSMRSRNSVPSPDEHTLRLYQECKIGRSNANLLLEALAFAGPQDLDKEFIQELHVNCRTSHQLIVAQIPGASIERSRSIGSPSQLSRKPSQRGPDRHAIQSREDSSPLDMTFEEDLFAALTTADETLQEALRIYDNLERVAVERRAEEFSRRFVSTDSKRFRNQKNHYDDALEETLRNTSESTRLSSPSRDSLYASVQSTPTPSDSPTAMPDQSLTQIHHPSAAAMDTVNSPSKPPTPTPEHDDSATAPDSNSLPLFRRGYGASRRRNRQVVNTLQEDKDQPLDRSATNIKSSGMVKTSEEDNTGQAIAPDGIVQNYSSLSPLFGFSPQSPENLLTYNPWNLSSSDMTASDSCHSTVEPTVSLDSAGSPPRDQYALRLPDFTGKIQREGEYPVGRGGFADVWKGVLRLQSSERKVAVKVLQARIYDSQLEQKIGKRIRREIAIWQGLDHENVLPLLGITSDFGRYTSLVSPWLENGSLMQYLDRNSDSLGTGPRLQLACEVAAGLSYLHSSQVVHGDLTGANVLITDQGKACLCDFGLSTLMIAFHGTSFYTSTVGGNARWAAPEIYRVTDDDEVERSVTVQSDVYSFGCIILEIFSGQVPYHYLVREAQVLIELQNGNRPRRPISGHITDTLWDIINACWADKPDDRPTMEKVGRYIKHQLILETLPR